MRRLLRWLFSRPEPTCDLCLEAWDDCQCGGYWGGSMSAKPGNIRLDLLDNWLRTPAFGRRFVYHRGELARDATADPQLAAVAARVRAISTGEFDENSACGHVRGHTTGSGEVEVFRRREQGVQVHMLRRR